MTGYSHSWSTDRPGYDYGEEMDEIIKCADQADIYAQEHGLQEGVLITYDLPAATVTVKLSAEVEAGTMRTDSVYS